MPVIQKVTDQKKKVTDPTLLRELAKQGIDKDYVEFTQDYTSRSRGKEYSPYAKFYRDLKSNKRFMVVSGLPKVKPDGTKIEAGWLWTSGKYYSKANLFSAIVQGSQIRVTALSDQPTGVKNNDQATWEPQLFLNGLEQFPVDSKPTLLPTDPINANYQGNTLEWDYGICKRRVRIIEGRIRDRWYFDADPKGEIQIKHNLSGNLPLRLGRGADSSVNSINVQVIGDEETIIANEFARLDIVYPITISGSPETFYPDPHDEVSSVDGKVEEKYDPGSGVLTWATIRGNPGNSFNDESIGLGLIMWSDTVSDRWRNLVRSIILFDTSGLPDSITITAATLSLRLASNVDDLNASPDVNIYSSNPASNIALENGDYASCGTTAFCDTTIAYADWTVGSYNDFIFNATGLAAVSKTGVSKFSARLATHDAGGTIPNWINNVGSYGTPYATEQGAGYKPKLVVTYIGLPQAVWDFFTWG